MREVRVDVCVYMYVYILKEFICVACCVAVKVRADIEVTCFNYDGIDSVKAALKAGQAAGTQEIPITVLCSLSHTHTRTHTHIHTHSLSFFA
jgi:hypothetical protein